LIERAHLLKCRKYKQEEYAMKSFLIGLGVGIGLGVLFAPTSGEETRENLSERANDLANSARDSYEQGRERIHRGVEQVKSTAGRAMSQVRTGTGTDL
jgi:gas vesicle protein